MDKREQARKLLLDKCISFFEEMRNKETSVLVAEKYGIVPRVAIIKYCDNCEDEINDYINAETDTTWKWEDGIVTVIANSREHEENPVSGIYYHEAGFWISWNSKCEKAFLIYFMGPRYGRAISYSLEFVSNENMSLINEKHLWVS